jgi:hypothetical protein
MQVIVTLDLHLYTLSKDFMYTFEKITYEQPSIYSTWEYAK